jgi:transcriptional regulator with XRE-family HTH domain
VSRTILENLFQAVRASIVELRNCFGMRQQDFAARLGIGVSTLIKYETEKAPNIIEVLGKLAALAEEKDRADLKDVFRRAIESELGEQVCRLLFEPIAQTGQSGTIQTGDIKLTHSTNSNRTETGVISFLSGESPTELTEVERQWFSKLLQIYREFPHIAILINKVLRVLTDGIKQARDSLAQNIEYFEMTVDWQPGGERGNDSRRTPPKAIKDQEDASAKLAEDARRSRLGTEQFEEELRGAYEVPSEPQPEGSPVEIPKRGGRKIAGGGR